PSSAATISLSATLLYAPLTLLLITYILQSSPTKNLSTLTFLKFKSSLPYVTALLTSSIFFISVITPLPLLPSVGLITNGKPIFFAYRIISSSLTSLPKLEPSGIGTLLLAKCL